MTVIVVELSVVRDLFEKQVTSLVILARKRHLNKW